MTVCGLGIAGNLPAARIKFHPVDQFALTTERYITGDAFA